VKRGRKDREQVKEEVACIEEVAEEVACIAGL